MLALCMSLLPVALGVSQCELQRDGSLLDLSVAAPTTFLLTAAMSGSWSMQLCPPTVAEDSQGRCFGGSRVNLVGFASSDGHCTEGYRWNRSAPVAFKGPDTILQYAGFPASAIRRALAVVLRCAPNTTPMQFVSADFDTTTGGMERALFEGSELCAQFQLPEESTARSAGIVAAGLCIFCSVITSICCIGRKWHREAAVFGGVPPR